MGAALWFAVAIAGFSDSRAGLGQMVLLLGLVGGGVALYAGLLSAFGVTGWREAVRAVRDGRSRDLRE
jgi:putative peptidoglycan lipid II flippase